MGTKKKKKKKKKCLTTWSKGTMLDGAEKIYTSLAQDILHGFSTGYFTWL
jgi:hypothetical protein